MGKHLGVSLVLLACLAFTGAAVAASTGPLPKLNAGAARTAALTKAGRFEESNPQVNQVSFEGCERRSPHRIRCEFYGRGNTAKASRVCTIAAIVEGAGTRAEATLQVHCKRVPRVLTIETATREIETVAEEMTEGPVVLAGVRRIGPLMVEATATWALPTTVREDCEARYTARLTLSGGVNITHTPPVCTRQPPAT
jgi:hypothetical protein